MTGSKPFSTYSEIETQRLESALEAAGIATWEFDFGQKQLLICDRFRKKLNIPADNLTIRQMLDLIHADDRQQVMLAFEHAIKPGSDGVFETEFRKGKVGRDVWVQWKGRASFDTNGKPLRFCGVLQDISGSKSSERELKLVVEQAPVATALYIGRELRIQIANDAMIGYWGKDRSIIGKTLAESLPELIGQPFLAVLDQVYTSGTTQQFHSTPAQLLVNGTLSTFYFDFTYKPLADSEGQIFAIMHMAVDVTERVLATRALESSEANLRAVIAAAPAAIGLFVGRELVVQMPNQAFIDIVGKGPDITGKPLREVMPELESQAFLQILDEVYTTGVMYQSFGVQVDIVQHGVMSNNYYNITYTPLFDTEGQVYAILDIAIDVTEKVLEQQQIEKSQMELLSLFEESPVGIAILSAKDLVFTMANPFYGELVGRRPDELVGKPLLEALPEIQGQGFDQLLYNVVQTGTPYIRKEVRANLIRGGKLDPVYVDLSYLPRRSKDQTIYGVLVVATDVTQQVISRLFTERAESDLRGAIELAELGTWQLDVSTGQMLCSPRLLDWLGLESKGMIMLDEFYKSVDPIHRFSLQYTIEHALSEGRDANLQAEFTMEQTPLRQGRILAMQGSVHAFEDDRLFINGTIQDITPQRQYQASLEALVQQRTQELEVAGEEMATTNEMLAATNEELVEANQQLLRSNDSLQQFSYVASHDLQEPLRKIQSFGDLLETKYGPQLEGGTFYLKKMQASAKRMSFLIDDLLSFSRVSYLEIRKTPVDLNTVMNLVLTDLELVVQEAGAVVHYEPLPVIEGDQSQLVQLFTNLISNAIKFRRQSISPLVTVSSQIIVANALPAILRSKSDFLRIDVTDNGIGFDPTYADRIFQVFQRLHGKNEFAGTGIGLAICEKVVSNHGGIITAASTPGVGSSFTVYLPRYS